MKCPLCGSADIVYSCEPKCCFNHVCGECRGTFEPATRATDANVEPFAAPANLPDASDPTAACARCESVAVYLLEDGRLACFDCRALLTLELTEICPP